MSQCLKTSHNVIPFLHSISQVYPFLLWEFWVLQIIPWTLPIRLTPLNRAWEKRLSFRRLLCWGIYFQHLDTSQRSALQARETDAGGNWAWQMPVPPVWVNKQDSSPASNPLVTVISMQPISCLGIIPIKKKEYSVSFIRQPIKEPLQEKVSWKPVLTMQSGQSQASIGLEGIEETKW